MLASSLVGTRAGEEDRAEDRGVGDRLASSMSRQAAAEVEGLVKTELMIDASVPVFSVSRASAATAALRPTMVTLETLGWAKKAVPDGRPTIRGRGAVGDGRRLLGDDAELGATAPAGVGVQAVVVGAVDDDVRRLTRAAEDFDAVVRAVVRLEVVDRGAGADAGQGQSLQFVVRRQFEARIVDLHVAQAARVARCVAAVVGAGALDLTARRRRSPATPAGQTAVGARPAMTMPPHWPCEVAVVAPSTFWRLVKMIGLVAVPSAKICEPRLTSR